MDIYKKAITLFIVFPTIFFLSACQFIRVEQAAFVPAEPVKHKSEPGYIFNPHGKESFVLKDKKETDQRRGYRRFCHHTRSLNCQNKLPYLRFVGMRGFFDTQEPIKTANPNYEYHPVIFENGDKYFFLSVKFEGGKYGEKSPIESLSFAQNIDKQPIVPNSDISVVGQYRSFGNAFLKLSNGQVLTEKQLSYIRDISAKSDNPNEVSQLLLGTNIENHSAYDSYMISSKLGQSKQFVDLLIGLNEKQPWLRFKVRYEGEKELGLNAYSIVADSFSWRSPTLAFEKKGGDSKFTESFEVLANNREIKNIKALASASKATVQLHGQSKSVHKLLKQEQKDQLANMLELYQLLAQK